MLIIAVTFAVKPAHLEAFRSAVLKNAAASLADEKDCHTFDVCAGANATIYLYERYANEAAFDVHLASAHFIEFDQLVTPWIESKTVQRYQLISPT